MMDCAVERSTFFKAGKEIKKPFACGTLQPRVVKINCNWFYVLSNGCEMDNEGRTSGKDNKKHFRGLRKVSEALSLLFGMHFIRFGHAMMTNCWTMNGRSSVKPLAKMGEAENWKEIVINFNTNLKIWLLVIFYLLCHRKYGKVIALMIAAPLLASKHTDLWPRENDRKMIKDFSRRGSRLMDMWLPRLMTQSDKHGKKGFSH